MRKPKYYFNPTFRQGYLLFVGWEKKAFERYCIEKLKFDPSLGVCFGVCMLLQSAQGEVIVIWTFDKKRMDITVHECVHAANITLQYVGVIPSFKNDEVQAYLTQELFRSCHGIR